MPKHPILFRDTAKKIIITYNYLDIAEGTGVVVFYGNHLQRAGSSYYKLLTTAIYSHNIQQTPVVFTDTSWTQKFDLDFEVVFNIPKTIKGLVKASIPIWVESNDDGNVSSGKAYVRIYKLKGGVGTPILLGERESGPVNVDQTPRDFAKNVLTDVLIPLTHFSKGDMLRIKVEVWGIVAAGVLSKISVAHDPVGRTTTEFPGTEGDTTIIRFDIPFLIEV